MRMPFDIAADLDTPVSAYLKLRPFQPHFLLESVEGGNLLGRYSFIGFGEARTIRIEDGRLTEDGAPIPTAGDRDLLDALREVLARVPQPVAGGKPASGLPFGGGLVGVTAYDVVRRFERLPDMKPAADVPEAAYVAPRSVLAFDHLTRRAALLHDGPEAERQALRREVIEALRGPCPARRPVNRATCRTSGSCRRSESSPGPSF